METQDKLQMFMPIRKGRISSLILVLIAPLDLRLLVNEYCIMDEKTTRDVGPSAWIRITEGEVNYSGYISEHFLTETRAHPYDNWC